MASLEITLQAHRDMLDIWHYIAADNETAANEHLAKQVECCRSIGEIPRIGRLRPSIRRNLRSYPVGQYLIFYRYAPRNDHVQIVRVIHGARDLNRVFKRRKR